MRYSDFTYVDARKRLGLRVEEARDPFRDVPEVALDDALRNTLAENLPLAQGSNTEQARSELLVMPLLLDLRRRMNRAIGLFSGVEFVVDEARGLAGFCDFIVSRSPELSTITAPVVVMVEAEENLVGGLGQCLAEMVAARDFNAREGTARDVVYGAVTTGTAWKFLELRGDEAAIDLPEYHIGRAGKVLGVLLQMVA